MYQSEKGREGRRKGSSSVLWAFCTMTVLMTSALLSTHLTQNLIKAMVCDDKAVEHPLKVSPTVGGGIF